MTTFGAIAIGWRAAKAEKRKNNAVNATFPARRAIGRIFAKLADKFWLLVSLGLLTTAAFLFNLEVGLVAAGVAAFVLDFEMTS